MKKLTGPILVIGSAANRADVTYGSGFRAVDPVVFLRETWARHLVVPTLELGRARAEAHRGVMVLTPRQLGLSRRAAGRPAAWARALLKRRGLGRVSVGEDFPVGVCRALERAGVQVRVRRGVPVFPERSVKRPAEIGKIRQSQQAAAIAMRTAVAMIAESAVGVGGRLRLGGSDLTAERLRSRIAELLFEHRCVGLDTIVAGGLQGADPHERGHGPLRAHEAIVIDIFPQHLEHGYWGDLTRTVVKGAPPAALRRMYRAVKAAQSAALAVIRPGVKARTVHTRAREVLQQHGFRGRVGTDAAEGFVHGIGHGVGLEIHEPPSLAHSDDRLRRGHVFTVEPGLYYRGVGGIRIEDTIVVTPAGWRYLAPCERRFEV